MVVEFRGSSSCSHLEGKSIVSIFRKCKVVVNVVTVVNDNNIRLNRKFTKLAKSHSSILQKLLKDKIITLENPRPLKEPYLDWYDANFFYQYHRVNGHNIECCMHLRHKI